MFSFGLNDCFDEAIIQNILNVTTMINTDSIGFDYWVDKTKPRINPG